MARTRNDGRVPVGRAASSGTPHPPRPVREVETEHWRALIQLAGEKQMSSFSYYGFADVNAIKVYIYRHRVSRRYFYASLDKRTWRRDPKTNTYAECSVLEAVQRAVGLIPQ